MTNKKLSDFNQERYDIIHACIESGITNAVAATKLGMSIRQVQRLKRAVETHGEQGIMHGNCLQIPWNAIDTQTKKKVVTFLKQKKHTDFGPTFAMEHLAKRDIVLSRESVRTIMQRNGLWKAKKRNGPAIHRQWRERKYLYGELVQFDGSYHDWFENKETNCLLAAIDDATSIVPQAIFDDNEGVHAVFRFWLKYIKTHGRPVAIYLDKFSTYKINHATATDNDELMTQFKRAMTDLDIKVINANSPEAKGRIERLFGTLQDRLVKEMRLGGIKDAYSANEYLHDVYLSDHNKRFRVPAHTKGDAHRPLTKELKKQLPSIFSIQSKRVVANDFTFRFKNQWYQLSATQPITVYRSDTVTVEERLDGTIHIRLKDAFLAFTIINKLERAARPRVTALTTQKPRWKPPADHPWKRAAAAALAKKLRHAR